MQTTRAPLTRIALPWLGSLLGLAIAIIAGLILARVLMSPSFSELGDFALYFAIAGATTMLSAWLVLAGAEQVFALSIRAKAFLGGVTAGAVALLNVLIVAEFMFISTDHDLKVLLSVILFSAIAAASLSLWIAHGIATRLGTVTGAVRRLAAGDLAARAHVGGGDEVMRLAKDVNLLGQRLQKAAEQRQALDRERRELTAAISHDLRTPLASLRAMVEALDDGLVEGDEAIRYHATMRREIDRLSRMIDDLFELARIDAGDLPLTRESVGVAEIAADVVDALQPQAKLKRISLTLWHDGLAPATVDGTRIERAIGNLVRNAIQHTAPGGRIEVQVQQTNGSVAVTVSDTGEGIEPEDLDRIWQRFYRGEKSRHRNDNAGDGAGLGLAIVRGIVEAHGGSVLAESVPGQGSTFKLQVPAG